MSRVTLDSEIRKRFNGLTEELEICDEGGKVLGRFLPESMYREIVQAYVDSVFPPHEMENARKETGGKTLAEIWKQLGRTS